jgi:lipopolysaccharide/colanic/teichoic acid biosynthesis glycosyltransferase
MHNVPEWKGKRLLDFCVAALALLFLAPLFLLISLVIALTMGSPLLFKHQRPGRNGKLFGLLKFRSMTNLSRGSKINFDEDAIRLTRFGKFLRKTSLDELPSLINVLKGDMSLVGPRPLLVEYLPLYSPFQARRHSLRPGLTGLAQIKGRTSLSWGKRFRYDVWYVDHSSFCVDAKILAGTVAVVIFFKGNSQNLAEAMPPFSGSPGVIDLDAPDLDY